METILLKKLIENAARYDEGLIISFNKNMTLNDKCVLFKEEEIKGTSIIFNITLSMAEFNDILKNLELQKPNFTKQEALGAIKFYLNNDAFISLIVEKADIGVPKETKPFLTEKQLAERWQISENTLSGWRVAGKGPAHYKFEGKLLYATEELLEYEKSCRRLHTSSS